MGSKRVAIVILNFFIYFTLFCSGNKGRPTSGFEGPGPVAIAPNIFTGNGEALFVGGITSHFIYGVNLNDFYPLDINGSAEGNKLDNSFIIDEIELTGDGRFLFSGGGAYIKIYDLLQIESNYTLSIDGWLTSLARDPLSSSSIYATTWDGRDGYLYKLKVNSTEGLTVESTRMIFPGMLPVGILLNQATLQSFPPLLYILFKSPPAIRGLDYSNPESGFVKEINLPAIPKNAILRTDGGEFYVIFEDLTLRRYRADGMEIIQTEAPGLAELPRKLESVPMQPAILPGTADYPEMVVIPDGMGFLDLFDAGTGCPVVNVSYINKGFTDAGDKSDPRIEEITLSSCNTKTEDWTVSYYGKIFDENKNNGKVRAGESIFIDESVNFVDIGIKSGDILSIISGNSAGEYAILEVIDSTTLKVNTMFQSDSDNLSYNIKGVPFLVKGSVSGIQKKRASLDEIYISDRGAISFRIIQGNYPVTEGDTFYISTKIERIVLEGLPYDVVVDSSNRIFVSNYASRSISVIDPTKLKVIDTLR